MKKYILTLLALVMVGLASATDLTGKRIYVNPGHGSFGPNDRPMATIPFPNLSSTGMPDTCGFYETNTNLWKCLYLRDRLVQAGATVTMSRTKNGPWPYTKVNGDYPDYTYDAYKSLPDYEMYNRKLSEICEEVEVGNYDMFLSVHSNALTDGTTTNYPLYLYSGYDAATTTKEQASKAMGQAIWPWRWEMFGAGYDQATSYSATNMNVRGDISFYGSSASRTDPVTHITYTSGLQVLRHGVPGGLVEGYFHTYQPARHRALNPDYCHMEGLGYFRGIMDYFQANPDTLGYICGTVKDMDNKMVHGLFNYAPKTNDQWKPCNGATVYLLGQAGDTLQSYQVDSFYNGTFVFYDLQPGTYHLLASCDGYYDLDAEQRAADVVVTANHTTYPFLYLRDTTWAPPAIVYETYPDMSEGVTGLNGKYNFSAAQSADFSAVVAGKKVRQVLVRDDSLAYVLALDTVAKASYIYRINTMTGALIEEVSTAGTQGDIYPVYNIAFTADSILVGCNYNLNHYTPSGEFRTYYWNMDSLSKAPTQWFSSTLAGNYVNANVGRSFAVAGPLAAATVYTDAMTTGSSHDFRMMMFTTELLHITSSCRNQEAGVITESKYGDYTAIVSPVADDRAMVLGEIKGIEYGWNADAQAPLYGLTLPPTKGGQAFKYGGQAVIAAPVVENGAVKTIHLYNITSGRASAGVVETGIAENLTTSYYSVHPMASGQDIVLYLATDDHIYRYTTKDVEQPKLRNIYAYDLKMEEANGEKKFMFSLNTEPTSASILFYTLSDSLVYKMPVENAKVGDNVVTLPTPIAMLDPDLDYKWAVEASAPEVGQWAIAEEKSAASLGLTRVFAVPNIYPETEHFATIYLMDRAGATVPQSGMYVMNPDLTLQNTTPYKGSQSVYASPYRFSMASDGFVFVGDWGDPHSGVYVIDPADPANSHSNFFAGSQNSSGLWKNAAGVEEGSSTPSVYVYGTGADTKLLVYNEDPGSTLPTNGLCVYNIGQPDGTILHSWDGAPSAKMDFAGQANTNGNVWGCSKGVWVSQHRSAGNNNSSASSLQFYNWAGERTFAGHVAPTTPDGLLVIDGSLGSCFALTPDEKTLILRGTDKNLMIFDVAWNDSTPTLTLRGEFKDGHAADFDLLQMNWDYAGNIIASGNAGVVVIAAPKENNTKVTPARAEYNFYNPFDHCLYEPTASTLSADFFTTGWQKDSVSTAVLDTVTGNIQVTVNEAKSERWQAQIKLNTGLNLSSMKYYSLAFDLKSNVAISGVTVRMFEKAQMLTDSTINLAADTKYTFFADSIIGIPGDGTLVFDFGKAPAGAEIAIKHIAICEVGEVIYEQLYEIGDNQNWKPSQALEMTKTSTNVFEGEYEFTRANQCFAFITVKPEADDDAGWALVNDNRFGPESDGAAVENGKNYDLHEVGNTAFKITIPGKYAFVVDLNNKKLTVTLTETALENIDEENVAVKFYRNGHIYIRKNGHIYDTAGRMVE